MYRKLSIPVGVAMLAALALVGMLSIFAFNAAQPAQAAGVSNLMVLVSDDATGATANYTFTFTATEALAANTHFININAPEGYTVADGGTADATVNGTSQTASTANDSTKGAVRQYSILTPVAIADGGEVTVVLKDVMNPATAESYAWMVDTNFGLADPVSASVMIGDMGDGTTTPDPMMTRMASSVDARPDDPGDATQITVKFMIKEFLAVDDSITLEVSDDLGVPSSIRAADVSIGGMAANTAADANTFHEVASPRSVIVETDSVAERYVITLNIGDMDDDEGPEKGLAMGEVTVTLRQEAGITNRTEGGNDDWFAYTSQETPLQSLPCVEKDATMACTGDNVKLKVGQIDNVYDVPWTISLSSYGDSRGEQITAIGKGFKNGTTTKFWRDPDRNGKIDGPRDTDGDGEIDIPGEPVLCSSTANGDDIATCDFTLSNPPFAPGKMGNYINAVDGRNKKAGETTYNDDGTVKSMRRDELKQIELEPSISVNPTQGIPGDSINVQLHDFQTGDVVEGIEFGRAAFICGNKPGEDDAREGCPTGTVGKNGSLSFSFTIPNSVTTGAQDLKVHTTNSDDNTTFVVDSGDLQLSTTDVLPNQRISVSGSGFTKSSNQNPAWIGDAAGEKNSCGGALGSVTLGGQPIPWPRINDGDGIEVTSGGTWSAPIDLPINSSTTAAGTRELKITDCRGGLATVDLTFAEREVTMTPAEGGVGTEVVISGKNYPVSNDDGTDIEVMVEYDAGVDKDDDDVEPDALGNFTVILEVPEDAGIPSNNTVRVKFLEDDRSQVLDTFTHRVPQGTVAFSATRGGEGSSLTITANGFARYTRVDLVEFGDREITPSPHPSTDTNGNAEFSVRIPGSDPGIYIIRVEIDQVVATSTFTVVSGSGVSDGAVATVLGNVISEDALDRIFRFDNTTKMWEWYISDPAFASTNNLGGLSSGDLVYIKVTKDVSADILGASTTLTCTNAGTDTEDCWNLIAIP